MIFIEQSFVLHNTRVQYIAPAGLQYELVGGGGTAGLAMALLMASCGDNNSGCVWEHVSLYWQNQLHKI